MWDLTVNLEERKCITWRCHIVHRNDHTVTWNMKHRIFKAHAHFRFNRYIYSKKKINQALNTDLSHSQIHTCLSSLFMHSMYTQYKRCTNYAQKMHQRKLTALPSSSYPTSFPTHMYFLKNEVNYLVQRPSVHYPVQRTVSLVCIRCKPQFCINAWIKTTYTVQSLVICFTMLSRFSAPDPCNNYKTHSDFSTQKLIL